MATVNYLFIYLFILPDKFIKNKFLFHIIDISWEATNIYYNT